jgi:hypothetical protein
VPTLAPAPAHRADPPARPPADTTALIGKWGLGNFGTTGYPNAQGFDLFTGQDTQVGCHNWYPLVVCNDSGKTQGVVHSTINKKSDLAFIPCLGPQSTCTWMNDLDRTEGVKFIKAAHRYLSCAPGRSLLALLARLAATFISPPPSPSPPPPLLLPKTIIFHMGCCVSAAAFAQSAEALCMLLFVFSFRLQKPFFLYLASTTPHAGELQGTGPKPALYSAYK